MPLIGYLSVRANDNYLTDALRRGLRETGYVEGENVTFEYRWAMGQYDRMPAMAAELARLPLAVLVTAGGEPAALAAKAATNSIPIVFVIGADPNVWSGRALQEDLPELADVRSCINVSGL
jgi:putative tryptophan/tyrosine transport system substrate-binding protein